MCQIWCRFDHYFQLQAIKPSGPVCLAYRVYGQQVITARGKSTELCHVC